MVVRPALHAVQKIRRRLRIPPQRPVHHRHQLRARDRLVGAEGTVRVALDPAEGRDLRDGRSRPMAAGIAEGGRAVRLARELRQHRGQLAAGDRVVRAEIAVCTVRDDARAVQRGDIDIVPLVHAHVAEARHAAVVRRARLLAHQAEEDRRGLDAGDIALRLDRAVRIAVDVGEMLRRVQRRMYAAEVVQRRQQRQDVVDQRARVAPLRSQREIRLDRGGKIIACAVFCPALEAIAHAGRIARPRDGIAVAHGLRAAARAAVRIEAHHVAVEVIAHRQHQIDRLVVHKRWFHDLAAQLAARCIHAVMRAIVLRRRGHGRAARGIEEFALSVRLIIRPVRELPDVPHLIEHLRLKIGRPVRPAGIERQVIGDRRAEIERLRILGIVLLDGVPAREHKFSMFVRRLRRNGRRAARLRAVTDSLRIDRRAVAAVQVEADRVQRRPLGRERQILCADDILALLLGQRRLVVIDLPAVEFIALARHGRQRHRLVRDVVPRRGHLLLCAVSIELHFVGRDDTVQMVADAAPIIDVSIQALIAVMVAIPIFELIPVDQIQ